MIKEWQELKKVFWAMRVQKLILKYHKAEQQYMRTSRNQFALFIHRQNKKIELYAKLRDLDPDRLIFKE